MGGRDGIGLDWGRKERGRGGGEGRAGGREGSKEGGREG